MPAKVLRSCSFVGAVFGISCGVTAQCEVMKLTEADVGLGSVVGISGDVNDNGVPDACDIASGTSADVDANGAPDECESCVADANGDGVLNILDFIAFQAQFTIGCPF